MASEDIFMMDEERIVLDAVLSNRRRRAFNFFYLNENKRGGAVHLFCSFFVVISVFVLVFVLLHVNLLNLDAVAAVVDETDLPVARESLDGPAVVVARLVLAILEGVSLQILAQLFWRQRGLDREGDAEVVEPLGRDDL